MIVSGVALVARQGIVDDTVRIGTGKFRFDS
jgi:hypothetical protein